MPRKVCDCSGGCCKVKTTKASSTKTAKAQVTKKTPTLKAKSTKKTAPKLAKGAVDAVFEGDLLGKKKKNKKKNNNNQTKKTDAVVTNTETTERKVTRDEVRAKVTEFRALKKELERCTKELALLMHSRCKEAFDEGLEVVGTVASGLQILNQVIRKCRF